MTIDCLRRPACGFVFCLAATIATGAEAPAPMTQSVQDLAAKVKPSVVVVTFDGRDGDRQGLGSGFIVDAGGLIATNLHVIGEARPIRVQLQDGRKFDVVSIQATDKHHDLAVLKIDAENLPALPLGDSDQLRDGESVVAIGNPLGLERSVVAGVLSGRRDVEERPMLQVAMPIEQGNSGGPLLDMQGRVHGLITLKSLKTDNLGFAAPVNQLKPLLADPNPIAMEQWLTIGVLDPEDWTPLAGSRWKQRAGRILSSGAGTGFGGRGQCLSTAAPPAIPYEVAVSVRFEPADGAGGLVFHSDGGDRHYGFYPSNGELRLTRFDGPDVYAWTVLAQVRSPLYRADGWSHLKVRVETDRIRCYLNDELVIESNDQTLRSGRVGLCKFRNTQAEFREFRIGAALPAREPSADILERIAAATAKLPVDRPAGDDVVAGVAIEGAAGLQALEREARQLEARARRIRELSAAVHEARIVDDFTRLVAQPEADLDLLKGTLLIAAIDNPELDIPSYQQEVDRIAKRIRTSLSADSTAATRLAAMKQDLFEKQGFHGSRHDYDHRSNSYLNEVIDDREGLPITLSVLFMEVARRLEVPVVGVGLPGHFVVRFEPGDGPGQLIDVFERGKDLSVEEAKARVAGAAGEGWDDEYLATVSKRLILVRMLRNLFGEARRAEATDRMLRYTNLILVIEPDSPSDRFYRAVLALQADRLPLARADADWLLAHELEGVSRRAVEDLSRTIDRELNAGK